jgi:hypothetical protein
VNLTDERERGLLPYQPLPEESATPGMKLTLSSHLSLPPKTLGSRISRFGYSLNPLPCLTQISLDRNCFHSRRPTCYFSAVVFCVSVSDAYSMVFVHFAVMMHVPLFLVIVIGA